MYAKKWDEFHEQDQGYALYSFLLPQEKANNLNIELVKIKPCQETIAHIHEDKDEAYLILDGKGILKLGNEEKEITKEMIVHIPPYQKHCIKNIDDKKDLKYISIASGLL
jgi:quercetin dioxygenase-like cupin family protein